MVTATVASNRRRFGRCLAAVPLAVTLSVCGDAIAAAGWRITPGLTVDATLTDNLDLSPKEAAESDFYVGIAPSLRVQGEGGRVKGFLDYQLRSFLYARNDKRSEIEHLLNAAGTVEAIDNWLFVDARANISQQGISVFGPVTGSNGTINRNQTESRTWQVSPYVQGQFGPSTDYLLRYSFTGYATDASEAPDYTQGDTTFQLKGTTALSQLTWQLDASDQRIDYNRGRDTQASRIEGRGNWEVDPQFRLIASAGYERNNFLTFDVEDHGTYGGGFEWMPTQRTRLAGFQERRFFGNAWNYSFSHRTPRTAWSISDTRAVTTSANNTLALGSGVAYDLVYSALTTRFPDPAERDAEARRILENGSIPADLGIPSEFVTTTAYVERNQQGSASLLGVRNNLTFSVFRTTRTPLGPGNGVDDFAIASETVERGASVAFSHSLSERSSLNAFASYRRASGNVSAGGTSLASRQWDARLQWITQIGRRTSAAVTYRHVRFENDAGAQSDYTENAVSAAIGFSF